MMPVAYELYDSEGNLVNSIPANFTDAEIKENIKLYRDAYIEQDVTYDNGSVTFTVINTKEERERLAGLETRWKAQGQKATIKFVHNGGIDNATLADLQSIQEVMFEREQKGYEAFDTVMTTHEGTPYTSLQDAYNDFDTEVA